VVTGAIIVLRRRLFHSAGLVRCQPPVGRPPDEDSCSLLEAASSRPILRRCRVVHHQSLTSVRDSLLLLA